MKIDNFGIEQLLSPVRSELFFEQYFRKASLIIPGHSEKFRDFASASLLDKALSRAEFIKIIFEQGGAHKERLTAASIALEEYRLGRSICCVAVEGIIPELSRLLSSVRESLLGVGKGRINLYYSPANSGFGLHVDDHDVWIMQLSGKKQWSFGGRPITLTPMGNYFFPADQDVALAPWGLVERPKPDSLHSVRLAPGNLLYLPPGTWHSTQALDPSLSLTLGFEAPTVLQFLVSHLRKSIMGDQSLTKLMPAYGKIFFEEQGHEEFQKAASEGACSLKEKILALNALGALLPDEQRS